MIAYMLSLVKILGFINKVLLLSNFQSSTSKCLQANREFVGEMPNDTVHEIDCEKNFNRFICRCK